MHANAPFCAFFHSTPAGLAIPTNFDGQALVLRGLQLKKSSEAEAYFQVWD
jgi:hypothetical protein